MWLSFGLPDPGVARARRGLKRGLPSSKQRCPPGSTTQQGSSIGGDVSTRGTTGRVVIRMDPHKRSATIEVMSADETVVGSGHSPPTVMVMSRCGALPANGRTGSGRSRAAPESASTSLSGCWPTVRIVLSSTSPEAVRPRTGVRDRTGTQDRRHRRVLSRPGRHPHERLATRRRRRATGGAATAGRPAPLAG